MGGIADLYVRVFGRKSLIQDLAGIADFIDQQAAFLVQKGIYEYSRARAGHYAKVLFREPEFLAAVEQSRWRAYPLGLAMVGEIVEGVLRPFAQDPHESANRLAVVVLSVFDRYPLPAGLDAKIWHEARGELATRLSRFSLHAPKPAMDIAEPLAKTYFDMMPIHRSLRGSDFPTIKSYLKVTLCNIHDELTKRIDSKAAADILTRQTH